MPPKKRPPSEPPAPPAPPVPPEPVPAEHTIYINYFDSITDSKVRGLMGVCSQLLAQKKPDRLYFLFASPGGQVTAGVVLHTFLKSLPVKITMHNTGAIDSIGNTIFVAGEQRFATAHSSFLFHGVSMNFGQGASLGSNMLQEKLSSIRADEAKIAGILSSRTKLSEDEVRQLFVQGESKDPIFALDKGIIDEVKEVAIPHGAEVLTVNFQ